MNNLSFDEVKVVVARANEFKAEFQALVRKYVPCDPSRITHGPEREMAIAIMVAIGNRTRVYESEIWLP
jgi:hypothetical protein